jgi:hypothetical protein
MTNHNILCPFVPCHAQIFLDEQCRANTYCMRENGHEGEHNAVNAVPAPKEDTRGQAD